MCSFTSFTRVKGAFVHTDVLWDGQGGQGGIIRRLLPYYRSYPLTTLGISNSHSTLLQVSSDIIRFDQVLVDWWENEAGGWDNVRLAY